MKIIEKDDNEKDWQRFNRQQEELEKYRFGKGDLSPEQWKELYKKFREK